MDSLPDVVETIRLRTGMYPLSKEQIWAGAASGVVLVADYFLHVNPGSNNGYEFYQALVSGYIFFHPKNHLEFVQREAELFKTPKRQSRLIKPEFFSDEQYAQSYANAVNMVFNGINYCWNYGADAACRWVKLTEGRMLLEV